MLSANASGEPPAILWEARSYVSVGAAYRLHGSRYGSRVSDSLELTVRYEDAGDA